MDSSGTKVHPDLGADQVRDGDLAVMVEDLDADLRRMSGRHVLITGGAGFLGYYLVQVPLAWNDAHPDEPPISVTVMDNYFRDAPAWLKELEGRPEVDLVVHDVRGPLPDQMGDFAYIIHAAGIASPTILPGAPHRDDGREHQRAADPARLRQATPRGGPGDGGLPLLLIQRDLRRPGIRCDSHAGDVPWLRLVYRAARLLRRVEALRRDALRELRPAARHPGHRSAPVQQLRPRDEDHRRARDRRLLPRCARRA